MSRSGGTAPISNRYLEIVAHYETCLERHGDTHLGVDWPRAADAARRYQVMLEVVRPRPSGTPITLLDFGCGAAHLYDYMLSSGVRDVEYTGLDLSEKFVALARRKFPALEFYCLDLLRDDDGLPHFDYIVLNGVFTSKRGLTFDEMLAYAGQLLAKVWSKAEQGIAFNVMSPNVDRPRDDLFHLPFDTLASLLTSRLSRNFVFRNDYGLYDYTAYVYR